MKFSSFKISDQMVEALKVLSVVEPTEIQKEVIPLALKNQNIIGISDTGSGKTYSFLIPILEKIDLSDTSLQAVIISPTRELAMQLYNVCEELIKKYNDNISCKRFVGGTDKHSQNTNCQIAIGTPGRIHDLFINDNTLRVDKTKIIVIDEADMVFEDNYLVKIDDIKSRINEDIQYMVFSATINTNLSSFIKKYLKDTKVIDCSSNRGISVKVEHFLLKSKFERKDQKLLQLLATFNPYTCLIFASNKTEVERLYYFLNNNGYQVAMIHGGLAPRQRNRIVRDILADKYQYIVASDIASRGMDLKAVTHVISYDLPNNTIFYSHRSGRSGRYNSSGISYVLYDESDLEKIAKIKSTGIEFKECSIIKDTVVEKKVYKRKSSKDSDVKVVITNKEKRVRPGYKKKNQRKREEALKKSRRKKRRNK